MFFGAGTPAPSSSIGSIRVQPDAPSRSNYTSPIMARAPLRELRHPEEPQSFAAAVNDLRGEARVREVRFGLGVARSNRRADALQATLDAARSARVAGVPKADTAALVADFAQSFHWALSIPGTHYSGLTNQHLLEILAAQGRPFAQDTPQLRSFVRDRLLASFASAAWERSRAVAITARAVREWIVRRLDEQGLDVELKPLDADYAASKRAHGYSGKIGVRTGAWRGSLASGVVEVAA